MIFFAELAAVMAVAEGAVPGWVGATKGSGWMVTKLAGFMERYSRPVVPSPRFEEIADRFSLCSC